MRVFFRHNSNLPSGFYLCILYTYELFFILILLLTRIPRVNSKKQVGGKVGHTIFIFFCYLHGFGTILCFCANLFNGGEFNLKGLKEGLWRQTKSPIRVTLRKSLQFSFDSTSIACGVKKISVLSGLCEKDDLKMHRTTNIRN